MNRWRGFAALLSLWMAAMAPPTAAIEEALDNVPGAFLLLPYFEVDVDDPNGPQTVFTLHNQSAGPILADVYLATDWGAQTLTFTVFLGPHSIEEIDLREVFLGRYPDLDPPASCPSLGPIDAEDVAGAVQAHRGEASSLFGGNCVAQPLGDGLLRGFAAASFPSQCGSFGAAPQGLSAADVNLLWGEYRLVERDAGVAVGEMLPSFEAVANGATTFASIAAPLAFPGFSIELPPAVWGIPFAVGDDEVTEVIVFHLSPFGGLVSVECGSTPAWFPLGQSELTAFDEDGDSVSLDSFRPFPAVTNRVLAGPGAINGLPVPFDEGWVRADFRTPSPAVVSGGNGLFFAFPYVAVLQRSEGSATLKRALGLPLVELE